MKYLLTILAFVLAIGIVGCDDESSNPADSNNNTTTPALPQVSFQGPNTNSSDPNAQIANSHAAQMNAIVSQSQMFAAMPPQQNSNTFVWTYTVQGLTYTLTAVKQNDGSFTWNVILNGTDGTNTFNNYKPCEGTVNADGKSGTWTVYDINGTKDAYLVYSTDANNVLTGDMRVYYSDGTTSMKQLLVNNPDGSGSLEIYNQGTVLSYRAIWTASGSGQWWYYDDLGAIIDQGSWT
ncbi:MAG: hypothetical protein JXA06_09160 [Bacteroidetes bacterium]|nr:hypothetical protein [Bacteroidota bacterium]